MSIKITPIRTIAVATAGAFAGLGLDEIIKHKGKLPTFKGKDEFVKKEGK